MYSSTFQTIRYCYDNLIYLMPLSWYFFCHINLYCYLILLILSSLSSSKICFSNFFSWYVVKPKKQRRKGDINCLHYETKRNPIVSKYTAKHFSLVIAKAQKLIWSFLAYEVKCSVHFLIWSFVTCEIIYTG